LNNDTSSEELVMAKDKKTNDGIENAVLSVTLPNAATVISASAENSSEYASTPPKQKKISIKTISQFLKTFDRFPTKCFQV